MLQRLHVTTHVSSTSFLGKPQNNVAGFIINQALQRTVAIYTDTNGNQLPPKHVWNRCSQPTDCRRSESVIAVHERLSFEAGADSAKQHRVQKLRERRQKCRLHFLSFRHFTHANRHPPMAQIGWLEFQLLCDDLSAPKDDTVDDVVELPSAPSTSASCFDI